MLPLRLDYMLVLFVGTGIEDGVKGEGGVTTICMGWLMYEEFVLVKILSSGEK